MKSIAHVVVTVACVAAGIAVYDIAVVGRRDSAPISSPREIEPSAPVPAAPARDAVPPPALRGVGDEHWQATIERRVAGLEAQGVARRDASTGSLPSHADATPGDASTESVTGSAADGADRRDGTDPVRPEDVRRFRQVLEAAEREIMIEKATRQIDDFLEKVGAKLTDEQRRSVVKTALKYQAKWREMSKEQPKGEAQIQERKEAYAKVMTEFEQEIRSAVPGVEANIIIDGIRRSNKEQPK